MLRFLTAGESHGQALVVIVEGLPAGLAVTVEEIQAEMARRRLGYGRGPRQRFEVDELSLLGGVRHGRTLGSPVAIEIQNAIGIRVSFGRTRETRTPGVYNLVYEMEEERVGVRAGKLALDAVEACAEDEVRDLDFSERLDDLKRLREKWGLGPSTKSIVDTAAARGVPHMRLNDRSFVMLGTGIHQKRIQATITSQTHHIAVEIASDKEETNRILGDLGLPVPQQRVVYREEEAAKEAGDARLFDGLA